MPGAFGYGFFKEYNDTAQSFIDMAQGLSSIYTGKDIPPVTLPNIKNLPDLYGVKLGNKYPDLQYVSDIGGVLSDFSAISALAGPAAALVGAKRMAKMMKLIKNKRGGYIYVGSKKVGTYYEGILFDSLKYLDDTQIINKKFAKINKQILEQIPKEDQQFALNFVDFCLNQKKVENRAVMTIEGVKQALKNKKDLEKFGLDSSFHGIQRAVERINPNMIPDVKEVYKTVYQADEYMEIKEQGKKFFQRELKKKNKKRYIEVILNNENQIITIEYLREPKVYK